MAKIVLGKRPETFKKVVKFPMLNGETGEVACTFRTRTRKEVGALFDRLVAEAVANAEAAYEAAKEGDESPKLPTQGDMIAAAVDQSAAHILEVLDGWDVDLHLNAENAEKFADEFPQGCIAIMKAYREAVVEGTLGN